MGFDGAVGQFDPIFFLRTLIVHKPSRVDGCFCGFCGGGEFSKIIRVVFQWCLSMLLRLEEGFGRD